MILVLVILAVLLLIVLIDYALGNKFSDAITEYIGHICSKLYNKNRPIWTKYLILIKRIKKFFIRPKFFGEKEYLPMQGGFPVITSSFNVSIPFNTPINILEMIGLDNYRWIVNNDFGLFVRNQRIDISNFCTVGTVRTVVFFIGENNKFTFNINRDTGETIIKTNSKEFDSEVAILTFGAKHIENQNKAYYGKASLELARKAQKTLEEKI